MTFWIPEASRRDRNRFELHVTPACCVGPPQTQYFMGGAGFAMAIEALERATGKPLLWASVQFLAQSLVGADVTASVDVTLPGRSVAQAVATVRDGDRVLHTTMAALGAREDALERQFIAMPDVPPPPSCARKPDNAYLQKGNLLEQFERRTARQSDDEGLEYLWIRPIEALPLSSGLLAIMADFFLGAHGRTRGEISLDNSFRLYRVGPPGWILNVAQLHGIAQGVVQGSVHQFDEAGRLLATASQTGLLPR